MKVLLFTTHLDAGGITTYVSMVATGLRARGHQVWVASGGGVMAEHLARQGISVVQVPVRTKSELHPMLWCSARHLRELIAAHHIQLIHAQTRVTQVVAQQVSRRARLPFLSTWHGFYHPHLGRRLWPCMGDVVVAISPAVAAHLRDAFHVPPQRLALIEHGIPVEQFQAPTPQAARVLRQEFGFPDTAFVVGTVARLVRDKGIDTLVRAIGRLAAQYPQLRCLIVGSGPEEAALIRLVDQCGVRDCVTFLGSQVELVAPLSAMDCFVMPTVGHEGFGLVMLEAMTMELPVIATTQPALRRVLDNGAAGVLVPPGDDAALAMAIQQFIDTPAMAEEYAVRGRVRVCEVFHVDRMLDQLEHVYQRAIQEHQHAATTPRLS